MNDETYFPVRLYSNMGFYNVLFCREDGETGRRRNGAQDMQARRQNLRDVLYMCSMNAIKTNPACKWLYDRLRANGKTGKEALVAVMNKLLKQVFAVVKNNSVIKQTTVL